MRHQPRLAWLTHVAALQLPLPGGPVASFHYQKALLRLPCSFHYQGALFKRISLRAVLHVVLFTYMLRMALYALLPYAGSAWFVLPIEVSSGCFGCRGWSDEQVTCIVPGHAWATLLCSPSRSACSSPGKT
jgi:hypothetical protein